MDESSEGLTPEGHGKARLVQHGSEALSKDLIGTLNNTILLWAVADSVLVLNATLGGEIEHGIAHVFTSLVISQHLQFVLSLVLSIHLELLESVENIRIGLNGQDKAISGIVVDECDPIVTASECSVRVCMHLASQTWFTDWIRRSPYIQLDPSD